MSFRPIRFLTQNKVTVFVRPILIASIACFGLSAAPAQAEEATEFLKSIEGSYAGRGKATLIGNKSETIACKISNSFAEGESRLSVSGECASTKGKGKVDGGIVSKNGKLTGTFVAPRKDVEITQSSGQYKDGTMILSATMMDHRVGNLIRVRQVISKVEDGIKAEFFRYKNATKTYEPSGEMKLKKR